MPTQMRMVRNDFEKIRQKMTDKANSGGAFSRIYPLYQKLQTNRFMTEGSSEGISWPPNNAAYSQYKKRRYGGGPRRGGGSWRTWPGAGTKMLVGTSTLAGAVIGPGSPFVSEGMKQHRAVFGKLSMQISVDQSGMNAEGKAFDYPHFVAEKRPFMKFSDKSIALMKQELVKFLIGKS